MRILPNYEVSTVHIKEPYELEKALFGIKVVKDTITPNEFFDIWNNKFLDFMSGFFYINWMPIPLAFGIYLFIKDKYLLAGQSNIGAFLIYNISDPAHPIYIASKTTTGECREYSDIKVKNNYAYVTCTGGGVLPHGKVGHGMGSVRVFNVSDFSHISSLSSTTYGLSRQFNEGQLAPIAIDLDEEKNFVYSVASTWIPWNVKDEEAYITKYPPVLFAYQDYPQNIQCIASATEGLYKPKDLVVAGNYIYIADEENGLVIYKIETGKSGLTEKMTKQEFINKIKEIGKGKPINLSKIEPCQKLNQWCIARDFIKWDEGFSGRAVFIDNYKEHNPPVRTDDIRFYIEGITQVEELDAKWLTDRINELVFKKQPPTPPTPPKITFSLSKGWNLISSPIKKSLTISEIEKFCSLGKYKGYKTWAFDANKQDWTHPSEINPTDGVYVWVNSDCKVEVEGEKQEFTTKELKKGWNLISIGNNSLEEVEGNCEIDGEIWEFDTKKGEWVHPKFNDVLDGSKSYWIKVKDGCTLK